MPRKLTKGQKKLRAIEVWWRDSISDDNRWIKDGDADDWAKDNLSIICSVGFVQYENKEQLVIVGNVSATGNRAGLWAIPKSCIVKIVELDRGK